MDEAGFTGVDLLNKEQPAFVVSSLRLSAEDVQSMIEPLRKATQSPEVKFKHLRGSRRGRDAVLEFIAVLNGRQNDLYCQLMYKRYALLGKMLDAVIEPMFFAKGMDFYIEGYNLSMLNLLYYGSQISKADAELDAVIAATAALCRTPDSKALDRLQQAVMNLGERSKKLKVLCEPLIAALRWRRQEGGIEDLDSSVLRLQSGAVVSLIRAWNQEDPSELVVMTDESKELLNDVDLFAAFSDPGTPKVVEVADGREIGFPLRLSKMSFVKSHDEPGVQLADVLAGAAEYVYRSLNGLADAESIPVFTDTLVDTIKEWPRMLQVVPQPNFTPEQLGRVGFDGSRVLNAAVASIAKTRRDG
jgi:hypothetical protein